MFVIYMKYPETKVAQRREYYQNVPNVQSMLMFTNYMQYIAKMQCDPWIIHYKFFKYSNYL